MVSKSAANKKACVKYVGNNDKLRVALATALLLLSFMSSPARSFKYMYPTTSVRKHSSRTSIPSIGRSDLHPSMVEDSCAEGCKCLRLFMTREAYVVRFLELLRKMLIPNEDIYCISSTRPRSLAHMKPSKPCNSGLFLGVQLFNRLARCDSDEFAQATYTMRHVAWIDGSWCPKRCGQPSRCHGCGE